MVVEIVVPIVVVLLILFIISPFNILFINLFTSFYFFVYGKLFRSKYPELDDRTFWNKPVRRVAKFWHYLGRVWHGYELFGVENVPKTGPAIFVLYHATVPIDAAFFLSETYLQTNRKVLMIVERLNSKIPGYKTFQEVLEHSAGTIESCVETMKRGDLLAIYPGGTREQFLADNYDILWKEEAGFAKIAKITNCPIIPVFTQNTRQIIGIVPIFKEYFKNVYRKHRLGSGIFFGWFPIKMRTFIGEPVVYEETDSVAEICSKAKNSLQELICIHQRLPNSVFASIVDRFRSNNIDNNNNNQTIQAIET